MEDLGTYTHGICRAVIEYAAEWRPNAFRDMHYAGLGSNTSDVDPVGPWKRLHVTCRGRREGQYCQGPLVESMLFIWGCHLLELVIQFASRVNVKP